MAQRKRARRATDVEEATMPVAPTKAATRTLYCAACRQERYIHELVADANGYYVCRGDCH